MLDTVRLGAHVEKYGDVDRMLADGWARRTVERADRFDEWLTWQSRGTDSTRAAWLPGVNWLAVEASLPRIITGSNADLLTNWRDCSDAMRRLVELAGDVARVQVPPLDDWTISRADPVHAWATNPTPYIAALQSQRLQRTRAVIRDGGVSWVIGKRVQGRAYDKTLESGHDVELPLRLERQITKPGARHVVRLEDGSAVGPTVADWCADTVLGLVRMGMRDLNLDKPIRTPLGALRVLQEFHGPRAGRHLYRVLLDEREVGGWDRLGVAKSTVSRYRSALRAAGVGGLADCELPPLAMPTLAPVLWSVAA